MGLTRLDVNRNGGPSAPTVAKAEAGALDDARPSTLAKFDAGLQWFPGTAARIYWDGDQPQPRERDLNPPVPVSGAAQSDWPVEQLLELMVVLSRLKGLRDEHHRGVAERSELESIARQLGDYVRTIAGPGGGRPGVDVEE